VYIIMGVETTLPRAAAVCAVAGKTALQGLLSSYEGARVRRKSPTRTMYGLMAALPPFMML